MIVVVDPNIINRIILIQHGNGPKDDRASAWLAAQGFALDWRHPFRGDSLPESAEGIAGTILYGGPQPVTEIERYPFLAEEARWVERCMAAGLPTLGICLGGQVIAHALGAEVGPHAEGLHEFGYYALTPTEAGAGTIPDDLVVPQAHYHQFGLPDGATLLARSGLYQRQAFRYGDTTFAFQFHPEVTRQIFRRWQAAEWASYDKPGAQTRAEQNKLGERHDPVLDRWFQAFLEGLFGRPAA